MRRILTGLVLAVLLSAPSLARAQAPSVNVWWTDYDTPVEQQTPGGALQPDRSLWVVNPTLGTSDVHVWDPDDQVNLIIGGTFQPGQEITYSTGLIGDWAPHFIGIRLISDRGAPLLRASIEIVGVTTVETGRAAIIVGPQYDRFAYTFPSIPNSNGGVGVVHRVIFRVWNPTDRRVRTDSASAAIKLDYDASADYGAPWPLSIYGQPGGSYPGPTWYWWVDG